jgi:hypothetical protein
MTGCLVFEPGLKETYRRYEPEPLMGSVAISTADAGALAPAAGRSCEITKTRFAPALPVFTKQLAGMLRAVGAVAAHHVVGRAVLVAAPAQTLRIGRVDGKLFL